jgi:hypothetical protein
MGTPSSHSRWRPMAAWAGRPSAFSDSTEAKEAKEAGRKVSKSGFVAAAIRELSVGLCRETTRCIGHRWACVQGCPAVGAVRELLTPRRRCCNRYPCPDLGYVPWTGLACGMFGPRRRFDTACMLCVLVIIMIVWILITSCSPL